ncbi:MAG: VWA-like domain-containing protein [Cyanobacteria bacterium P01_H01_bin.58]
MTTQILSAKAAQTLISASLLRLRMRAPFFATLALFARFIPTSSHPTAATDGRDVYYNPEFLANLSASEQDGLLLHEVLHAALLHPVRRGVREAERWNIAADIVVNGIIAQQPTFALPEGGLRAPKLEHLGVEEVYEILCSESDSRHTLHNPDLLNGPLLENGTKQASQLTKGESSVASELPSLKGGIAEAIASGESLSNTQKAELEAHWKNALMQAEVVARTTGQGKLPAGVARVIEEIAEPQLDWRTYLWRYLVQTPTDFQGFDRRFVYRGLYLEALHGESVQVYLCVDTSGSIYSTLLEMFLGEVHGILAAYPHINCELYYADVDLYGPYELSLDSQIPSARGGGGTSFVPFFQQVNKCWDQITQGVCIYFTDGYGVFPNTLPDLPTLWVITPGGLPIGQFPFGEAVRLSSNMARR